MVLSNSLILLQASHMFMAMFPISDPSVKTGSSAYSSKLLRNRPDCRVVDIANFITRVIKPKPADLFIVKMDIGT